MIAYLPLRTFGLEDEIENLGIPGDTTIGVMKRLMDLDRIAPTRVILNIGSNDLVLTDLSPDQIVKNILAIKDQLESKGIPVTVVSTTPVLLNSTLSNMNYIQHRTNQDLKNINQMLSDALPKSSFVDVFHVLLGEDNQLNEIYTTDGIHLNQKGYTIYLSQLNLI